LATAREATCPLAPRRGGAGDADAAGYDISVGRAFVAAGVSVAVLQEPAIPAMARALGDAAGARLSDRSSPARR
jgi:hypothetical protein